VGLATLVAEDLKELICFFPSQKERGHENIGIDSKA